MKKTFLSVVLVMGMYNLLFAQATGVVFNRGIVYTPNQYTEIEGNPYLGEGWLSGEAITNEGQTYNLSKINLDMVNNKFIYNQNDTTFEVPSFVKEVVLNSENEARKLIFKNGFDNDKQHFFEILADGKISLLKDIKKKIEDEYEYGNADKIQRFKQVEYYYILDEEKKIKQIVLSEKDLRSLLEDKWDQVQTYAKRKKISYKNEDGWIEAISYYNSLSN